MRKVVPGDLGSCFGEVSDSGFGVDGVPGDDGVGEEGYTFAFEVLVFGASASQLPLVSEDELPAESVLVPPARDRTWLIHTPQGSRPGPTLIRRSTAPHTRTLKSHHLVQIFR